MGPKYVPRAQKELVRSFGGDMNTKLQPIRPYASASDNGREISSDRGIHTNRRRRVSLAFTAALAAGYWTFVFVITGKFNGLQGQISEGLSVAMLLGFLVIFACLMLTFAYLVVVVRLDKSIATLPNRS